MKQRTKTLLRRGILSSLLGSALLVGSVGTTVALAQTSGGSATSQAQGQQTPNLKGSIKLPQEDQSDAAEAAAYTKLAKVTLDEAVKAAQSSLGVTTTPSSAELNDENGFLVWEIDIGQQTVKVDAGNGKVLQTEQVGAEEMADDGESYDHNEGDDDEGSGQQEQNEGGMEDGD